jgi:hypothetical protein
MTDCQTEHAITAEEHLAGAAAFMNEHGISAVLVSGDFDDGQRFEGIGFADDKHDLGEVRFVGGRVLEASIEEQERRLAVAGFVNRVVRPVQRAAHSIYEQGGDLLDERLDVLPGFDAEL